jgi:sulfonate transport system permease protein
VKNAKNLTWRFAGLIVVALMVWGWQAVADARLISPVYLPSPARAFAALVRGFTMGDLGIKFLGTIDHMIEGWLVASTAGVALGALIGSSRVARAYLEPVLEFLRPLPASAIIPVAIAIFGLTRSMAIGVIAFGAIWPMLLATVHGFAAVEPRLYEVARMLHLSRAAVVFKIALPSALPDILAGLRLGLTVALILSVVCEMIAGLDGLGNWVLLSARMFRSPDLFAGVILLGVLGFAGALALNAAERYMLAWRPMHG